MSTNYCLLDYWIPTATTALIKNLLQQSDMAEPEVKVYGWISIVSG